MDDFFGPPIIDKDEWRDAPTKHRYVHGGFEGTDTQFAFYFPEESAYEGRFIQFLEGGLGGSEHQGSVFGALFIAAENKAYYLESNQGHIGNDMSGLKDDMSILEWRASAQSARFARELAAEMYGEPPHHGYIFGGSGGAMRSVNCIEAGPDIWDGAVPFMINRAPLINYHWSIAAWAGNVLGDKVTEVIDAMDAGGSGDPFSVLDTDEQRQALAALYRAGYCRGAESQLTANPLWVLGMGQLLINDGTYFDDFWTEPGYEGTDGAPGLQSLLIEEEGKVLEVVKAQDLKTAQPSGEMDANFGTIFTAPDQARLGIRIDATGDPSRFLGAAITFTSGMAKGSKIYCTGSLGNALVTIFDPVGFRDVEPGDKVIVENRDFAAYLFYHRHALDYNYSTMRHFFVDGLPLYVQRPLDFGSLQIPDGRFKGKMIMLQHAHDRECWPMCAEAYIQDVNRNLGDRTDDTFRIWWVENAAHIVPLGKPGLTRLINYGGCYAQAVADLITWVERNEDPPKNTRYDLTSDGLLNMPSAASARMGIQPVVSGWADNKKKAEVKVRQEVNFLGKAETPPGAGTIVSAKWDFDGSGTWPFRDESVDGSMSSIESKTTHAYDAPGTYIATFCASSQREGESDKPLRKVTNLARVRVIVND